VEEKHRGQLVFGNIVLGAVSVFACVVISGFCVAQRQQKWTIAFRVGVLLLMLAAPVLFAIQSSPKIPEGEQAGPRDGFILLSILVIWLPLFSVCMIWTAWTPVAALAAAIRANRPVT
jgi:phosphatidylserine synthase